MNQPIINRALCRKYFTESLLLLIACAAALFAFSWFRVWVVGELDTARFKQIVDMLPEDWRKFSSVDFDWLVSYLGRTSLTLEEPMLLMIISIWAIVRGSDVVSGEVSRGTMEMLLAQPVSRYRVYYQHMLLTLAVALGFCLLVWMGMSIGIMTTSVEETTYPEILVPLTDYRIPLTFLGAQTEVVAMDSRVSPLQFFPGIVNLFSFVFFMSCLAAFCSSWDRYRWRTLGLVIGLYLLNAMVELLSLSSETFAWLGFFNFFGYYAPAPAIQLAESGPSALFQWVVVGQKGLDAGPLAQNLILFGLGLILLVWGGYKFNRRDLPAPL
ncbi:MAG: ABC transporter permease subunit [Mariniblastus sp.]|nr:ABC transporter permease subunit [Mariniblastus sp.]